LDYSSIIYIISNPSYKRVSQIDNRYLAIPASGDKNTGIQEYSLMKCWACKGDVRINKASVLTIILRIRTVRSQWIAAVTRRLEQQHLSRQWNRPYVSDRGSFLFSLLTICLEKMVALATLLKISSY